MSSKGGRKNKPQQAATRRVPDKPTTVPTGGSTNLKDHPVFVVGGTAVAAFVLAMGVFTQIVLPNQTAVLDNEVRALKVKEELQAGVIKHQATALGKLRADLAKASASLATASGELHQSRLRNLFSPNSPYPNGASLAHVGMPLKRLEEVYDPAILKEPDPDNGWIRVELKNSPIEQATYYFDRDEKADRQTVRQILFFFDRDLKDAASILEKLIMSTYGKPLLTSTDGRYLVWNFTNNANLFYKKGDDTFMVCAEGIIPGDWR